MVQLNPVKIVKKWLFSIAAKKVLKRAVQLIVAWLSGLGLSQYGVDLNPEAMILAAYSGLELLRNYLKVKYPEKFGWL